MNQYIDLGGIKFSSQTTGELFGEWDDCIARRRKGYVCFCEAHLWTRAVRDRHIADALNHAAYVLPDGVGITLGARLNGDRFLERQPGPILMLDYCAHGLSKGYKHFFYGGAEGVAISLKQHFEDKFPGIQIVGTFCPPFRSLSESEKNEIVDMINGSEADMVWVGLGAPKQELWMAEFCSRLNVPLLMGVGAAFDFHSENRKWAPAWVRKAGLEWLFRALTGGPKIFMRYVKTLPVFAWLIGKNALKQKFRMM